MKKILLIALLLSSLIGAGQISNQDSTVRKSLIEGNTRGIYFNNYVPYGGTHYSKWDTLIFLLPWTIVAIASIISALGLLTLDVIKYFTNRAEQAANEEV